MLDALAITPRARSWLAIVGAVVLAASSVVVLAAPAAAAAGDLTTRTNATFYLVDVAPLSNGDLYITHSTGNLYRVDRETLAETIVDVGAPVSEIAVGSNDNLYAYSVTTGHIYRVDATSAAVEVIAGNGGQPSAPVGQAMEVGFAPLEDMIIDGNGDLVLADPRSGWISRIDLATGTIDAIAGLGSTGSPTTGAIATSTGVAPVALASDADGNIYFVQIWNTVYRIDAETNLVSHTAGSGSAGFGGDHGLAVDAAFYEPDGLAIDTDDNLYVGDTHNRRVRRIDLESGIVTTIAGGAEVDSPNDINPRSLAVDEDGNLLMVDSIWVRSLESAGAAPAYPQVSDPGPGEITTISGEGIGQFAPSTDKPRPTPRLERPSALALNDRGEILVADRNGEMVLNFDPTTSVFERIPGLENWSSSADGFSPNGFAFDTAGNLFMSSDRREFSDRTGYRLDRLDRSSQTPRSTFGFDDAPLVRVTGLASDVDGIVYLADAGAHRIYRLDPAGPELVLVAGTGIAGFGGDGQLAVDAQLSGPEGVHVLQSGELLVADTGNNRLRIIDMESGVISTVSGDGLFDSSGDDGPAVDASLHGPLAVSSDGAGDIFVSEGSGHRVRHIDRSTGVISTVAGTGIEGSTGDGGLAIDADLANPGPLLVDHMGNLWIVELGSTKVRMVADIAVPVALPVFETLRQCAGVDVTIELDDGDEPTFGDDVILGTSGPDEIYASWGNDIVCALQGDDIVDAGHGFDQVYGGAGSDTIDGGIGNDKLVGGPGNDTIRSGLGNDRAFGGAGNDVINGGNGTDRLAGGTGNDVLRGDRFADELLGNQGRDQLFGGDGDDILRGGLWIDQLDGGNQRDACSTVAGEIRTNCETGLFLLR